MKIVQVPISDLKPSEYNPRVFTEESIKQVTKSIEQYGVVDALIANNHPSRHNILIGGHLRLMVLKQLGYKKVPVYYVNISDIEKEKTLNLLLNRAHGDWSWDLLKNFDTEMLLDVGFSSEDLSNIWDNQIGIENDDFDEQVELEKITEPITKPGDLILLGQHRLLCGDATSDKDVARLMDDQKADCLYTDPIYGIGLSYNKGLGGQANYGGTVDDNFTLSEYEQFIYKVLTNVEKHMKSDHHTFVYSDVNKIGVIQTVMRRLGLEPRRVTLWLKGPANPTPNVAFSRCYEPCVYSTRGKPYLSPTKNLDEIMNAEISTGNRALDDIYDLIDLWMVKRVPGNEISHATQKPLDLHEKPLKRTTKPGDLVVDVFAGSGSTLLSCEQLGRRCYTMDIEPRFCDLICNRYEQQTGKKVKLIRN